MENKRICAVTMLRKDDFFLEKWVTYYGGRLGRENLYIYFDGDDQEVPAFCGGCNTSLQPKIKAANVVQLEKTRLAFLSDRAAELLASGYDMVIGVDVDEFLIPDPQCGMGLAEFLSHNAGTSVCLSGLGIDVGENLRCETDLLEDRPILEQRSYALLCTRYTKPSVITAPVRWGRGFHRVKGHNYRIVPKLYLFHFGSCSLRRTKIRLNIGSKVLNSSERHLHKRAFTINIVSTAKVHDWEKTISYARRIQSWFRPVYAWNKPSMLGRLIVVRIPARFRETV